VVRRLDLRSEEVRLPEDGVERLHVLEAIVHEIGLERDVLTDRATEVPRVRDDVERDHSEELIDRHLAERALHDLVEVRGSERRLCRGSGRGEGRLRVGTGGITRGGERTDGARGRQRGCHAEPLHEVADDVDGLPVGTGRLRLPLVVLHHADDRLRAIEGP
jgi:hypothetical protein